MAETDEGRTSQAPLRRTSTSYTNDFDDSFLGRVKSFVRREPHIGQVSQHRLRFRSDIEIHSWYGEDDPENPFNWSPRYKWTLTIAACIMSILSGIPAGSYGAGANYISPRFRVKDAPFPNLFWATTSWNMGAALWPLLFVPLTESCGRMPGYFIAYPILIIFLFPCAFASNFATLIVTRFFGGGAFSVVGSLVGGTISDIWSGDRARSIPMSLFGLASVTGISLGPFIGSAIQAIHLSNPWRWIFYVQIIYNTALLPVFWFLMRETRAEAILSKRAKQLRKETGRPIYALAELHHESIPKLLQVSFERPTRMLFTEGVVGYFTIWISFAWGVLFLLSSSVVQTFNTDYDMNTLQTGMISLAVTVGAIIGTLLNPVQDAIYQNSRHSNAEDPLVPIPEARIYTSISGSLIMTSGLFLYGWTSLPSVHWIAPTCGIALIGLGIYSIYTAVANYVTDAYEKYASSALAATSFGWHIFAAFLPLAGFQLFDDLGYEWAGTVLGIIAMALTVVAIVCVMKGEEIRKHSPFMTEAKFGPEEEEVRLIREKMIRPEMRD